MHFLLVCLLVYQLVAIFVREDILRKSWKLMMSYRLLEISKNLINSKVQISNSMMIWRRVKYRIRTLRDIFMEEIIMIRVKMIEIRLKMRLEKKLYLCKSELSSAKLFSFVVKYSISWIDSSHFVISFNH